MNWDLILTQTFSQMVGPSVLVYTLAAIGLNVQFGYTGLLNFGQAAFAGIGAYGVAIGVATLGWPFWWSILLGLAGAVVLALLLGLSTMRVRAEYLAITTVAAAEALRRVARSVELQEWAGGPAGLRQFAGTFRQYGYSLGIEGSYTLDVGPFFFTGIQLWVMIVGWALVGLCLLVVWLAMRSPWGRVLRAVREDEEAVRSLGKNAFSYKVQALLLGGVIGALAGFIGALRFDNVAPDQYHAVFTFYAFAVLILGGAARVFGPVLGALLFWGAFNFLTQLLRGVAQQEILPAGVLTATKVDPLVFVLLGLGIIAMLVFRPQGILGDRREVSLDVR